MFLAGCTQASTTLKLSALANLSVGYNLSIIGYVLEILDFQGDTATENQQSAVAAAAVFGAIIGQLCFGFIGDIIGVTSGLKFTLLLSLFGCFVSAFLTFEPTLYFTLGISRLIVGIGCGGVYPLSAVASAEDQAVDYAHRGKRMILVFAFQGVGQLMAPISVLILDVVTRNSLHLVWRGSLLIGSLFSLWALTYTPIPCFGQSETQQAESGRSFLSLEEEHDQVEETFDSNRHITTHSGEHQVQVINNFSWMLGILKGHIALILHPSYRLKLVGTAVPWFLFDVFWYGNLIFAPFVLERVFGLDVDPDAEGFGNSTSVVAQAIDYEVAGFSALLLLLGLPGVILAAYRADVSGRKQIQMVGFALLSLLFFLLSAGFEKFPAFLLFIVYSSTFFFTNYGPNSTTFCLPAETFPADVRSFFNGLSAATGKVGAVLGATTFKIILDGAGIHYVIYTCSGLALAGCAVTYFFVEDHKGEALQPASHLPRQLGTAEVELAAR